MKRKAKRAKAVRCPKCGSWAIATFYHKAHDRFIESECAEEADANCVAFTGEHLYRCCQNCEYKWRDKCLTQRERGQRKERGG